MFFCNSPFPCCAQEHANVYRFYANKTIQMCKICHLPLTAVKFSRKYGIYIYAKWKKMKEYLSKVFVRKKKTWEKNQLSFELKANI